MNRDERFCVFVNRLPRLIKRWQWVIYDNDDGQEGPVFRPRWQGRAWTESRAREQAAEMLEGIL